MGKKRIQDKDYEIIDNGAEMFHHVKLGATSDYPDVVFQYGEVKLIEEDDSLRVKFEYEVFENPNKLRVERSDEFVDYIGEILMINLEEILICNKYSKGINAIPKSNH